MVELNKHANAIINKAHKTGESVTIIKHGKPIAKISPINDKSPVEDALNYLTTLIPVSVDDSIESVINNGRQYGL